LVSGVSEDPLARSGEALTWGRPVKQVQLALADSSKSHNFLCGQGPDVGFQDRDSGEVQSVGIDGGTVVIDGEKALSTRPPIAQRRAAATSEKAKEVEHLFRNVGK
jgi:hypothetical protein